MGYKQDEKKAEEIREKMRKGSKVTRKEILEIKDAIVRQSLIRDNLALFTAPHDDY